MKLEEFREKLTELQEKGKLTDQTVEVVDDTHKYFIESYNEKNGKLIFEITREFYTEFSNQQLFSVIEKSKANEVYLRNKDKNQDPKALGDVYLSHWFLELVASE